MIFSWHSSVFGKVLFLKNFIPKSFIPEKLLCSKHLGVSPTIGNDPGRGADKRPDSVYLKFPKPGIFCQKFGNEMTQKGSKLLSNKKVIIWCLGYQNAPAFCENMDLALGTYSFEISQNFKPGNYTFAWMWIFRDNKQFTTCWEGTDVSSIIFLIT